MTKKNKKVAQKVKDETTKEVFVESLEVLNQEILDEISNVDAVGELDVKDPSMDRETVVEIPDAYAQHPMTIEESYPAILIPIKVVNTSSNPLPKYETKGSVGMDVRASMGDTILPNQTKMIHTGLYVQIPDGYEIQVRCRSGLAYKGIQMANGIGTIDSDYRGECNVLLHNVSNVPFKIIKGDRIAQFVLSVKPQAKWVLVDELEESDRGNGGFGSTGKD